MAQKIYLVPRAIYQQARKLRNQRNYKQALKLLQDNVAEFEIIGDYMKVRIRKYKYANL